MKLSILLLPAILTTTAAWTDSQTQAAALLSRPRTPVAVKVERSSSVSETAIDAHASAAALLSGQRIAREMTTSAVREPSYAHKAADAHAQAAALLGGTRTTAGS